MTTSSMPPPLTASGKYNPWDQIKAGRKGLEVCGEEDPFRIRRINAVELYQKMFDVRQWLADEHNAGTPPWYAKLQKNSVVTLTFTYSDSAKGYAPLMDVEFVFGRPLIKFSVPVDLDPLYGSFDIGPLKEPIRVGLRANGADPKKGIAYCHFHISNTQQTIQDTIHELALNPALFMARVQAIDTHEMPTEITKDFSEPVKGISFLPPRAPELARVTCQLGANVRASRSLLRLLRAMQEGNLKEPLSEANLSERLGVDIGRVLALDPGAEMTMDVMEAAAEKLAAVADTGDEGALPSCLLYSGPYVMDDMGNVIVNGETFWATDWQNPAS